MMTIIMMTITAMFTMITMMMIMMITMITMMVKPAAEKLILVALSEPVSSAESAEAGNLDF